MCGIFGYVSYHSSLDPKLFLNILVNGLRRLEYRGYDSSGLYVCSQENPSILVKSVGNIDELQEKIKSMEEYKMDTNLIGIAHTRWATHGRPSILNTHPHLSNSTQDFVVVHNGIITNHNELKLFLQQKGFTFETDTDTEVIPKLCKYIHDEYKPKHFYTLIKDVIDRLEGSLAVLIVSKHYPFELIASKRGSPLILGLNEEMSSYIIASDVNAVIGHTRQTIVLQDDDILHISKEDGFHIYNMDQMVSRNLDVVDISISQIMKGKYKHFMEKEIFEQVHSVSQTMNGRVNNNEIKMGGIFEHLNDILFSTRLVFIASGTSYHACLAVRPFFERITRLAISVENSCDFVDRGVNVFPSDTCIFVSQSGETADVLSALRLAKKRRSLCIGITNTVGSTIDRETLCGIHVNAGTEIGVASTKSYTSQIIVMILLALVLSGDYVSCQSTHNLVLQDLHTLPTLIQHVLNQSHQYELIATNMMNETNILFVGRGYNYATALEASLKIKEVAYIHCEGIIAGELKHGPLALIDDKFLVVIIATHDDKIENTIEQLLSRNARLLILTNNPLILTKYSHITIIIPTIHQVLQPILDIIPFQLIAYYLAVLKNYNVDQPRNLAKSVTVSD